MTEEKIIHPRNKIHMQNAEALERQQFPAMMWLISQFKKNGATDGVLLQVDDKGKALEIEDENGQKVKAVGDDNKPLPYSGKFGTSPEAIAAYITEKYGTQTASKAGE